MEHRARPHPGELASEWPDYALRLLDMSFGQPGQEEQRAEAMRRGHIPTNNLSLYIVDDPSPTIVRGVDIPNHYDWRAKPFGHLIENLHTEHPVLWECAKEVTLIRNGFMNIYWRTLQETNSDTAPEAVAVGELLEEAQLLKDEIFTDVIKILGPQMVAEGFDPVDVYG